MPRKPKDGRHGGYRHGVPGGKVARVEARLEIDRKERWQAAAVRAGYTGPRDFAAWLVEMVEAGIRTTSKETTMTTIESITQDQIRALRRESAGAGDTVQVVVCDLALGRIEYDPMSMCAPEMEQAGCTTREEAIAECARVIREVAGQD